MSGGRLESVWKVSKGCLECIYGLSEWYVACLDVSEEQVRTGLVRTGLFRTRLSQTGQVENFWDPKDFRTQNILDKKLCWT